MTAEVMWLARILLNSAGSRGATVLEQEFRRVYNAHSHRLYNYILFMTRDTHVSQDVLQSVFIKVWRNNGAPKIPSELQAWLFTIARNACLDFFRARQRRRRLNTGYAEETNSQPPVTSENTSFTWELLDAISEEEKSVIYMHFKMGYNYREIGRVLGMEENAVRVKAFRAVRRLRDAHVKGLS